MNIPTAFKPDLQASTNNNDNDSAIEKLKQVLIKQQSTLDRLFAMCDIDDDDTQDENAEDDENKALQNSSLY
eukprot:CAMPEP_0114586604 /NCGR_PEP_ID=MMETSP0125-20121206/9775_1 /TAXON_ID=485358 ORGANISM="Aristerostoma sp., Strain ATCC 50986" /NCGR_SAMPLE_ID=MMETSP0125 /ASSEMBLY_ACC=CAM_ASM_000245 /LENGTH=71 /DNA_ID=CAMNT_0001782103 /DNA_START=69 /DNA_END=284 /DNA_ORIENTATION=+